jgi:hypothetical protein
VAESVIADYRTPLPSVRENQWIAARDLLARALASTPDDDSLRAGMRYCEGHLHRINGEARRARREPAEAKRELSAAVAAFREAAELSPEWPDPFVALARTFVYGLDDVDRGADALAQAERHGYRPSERDTAQLGDGYRARGNTLVRSARQLAGMPQEADYLTRAAEAYREALNLYAKAGNFGNVTQNVRYTHRALNQVEQRLADLTGLPIDGRVPAEAADAVVALPRPQPPPL